MNTKVINLDINDKLYDTITAKQGDLKSRFLKFILTDSYSGRGALDLEGINVRAYASRPDGKVSYLDLEINDAAKGECTLELTNQMLAIAGKVKMELLLYKGDAKYSSIPFVLNVIGSVNNDKAIESSNEFGALTRALDKVNSIDDKFDDLGSQLDTIISYEDAEDSTIELPSDGNSNGGYTHPATHPASMITGLSKVATSGSYIDLLNKPTKLSEFQNDLNLSGSGGSNITIENTLDNYSGNTLNEKMVAMFNDINVNHKNTPMVITLPSGIIEITTDLTANGWTNKIFKGDCYLYYKNCNAIEFKQCMHNNFYIHASSSANLDITSGNIIGLINPSSVSALTKRGYKISDCSYNDFNFNNIIGFTNGFEVYSEYGAKGSFYNNIHYTAIWRCQRPYIFRTGKASDDTAGQSGWITEIFIHGGMFDCNDGVLIGQELANRPSNEPSDNYQGLKFYNVGVEHIRKKENGVGFYFLQGKNNAIINPRFEGSLLAGNSTSGAYILVKESGYACNNRIETSNYPINVDRVQLNALAKQLANPSYDNPAGSYIEGDLYDNNGSKCGYKAIATPGKMIYEARNLSAYYLNNAKNNTFNYTYADTEFAKVKTSDGTIKTIGYTG